MVYDSFKIAKFLNISKTSAKAKFKLPEVIPFLKVHNGKTCVEEKGLEMIKQSLKYNKTSEAEVAAIVVNPLKEEMIEILKNKIEFIKQQLNAKDGQLDDINKLLQNTQVLFIQNIQKQEKNKIVLSLPKTIKEHDIQLVNSLTKSLERQKIKTAEENLHREKGIFQKLFNNINLWIQRI